MKMSFSIRVMLRKSQPTMLRYFIELTVMNHFNLKKQDW